MKRILPCFIFCLLFLSFPLSSVSAQTVGKWERYVISLPNTSYTGNPFELEVDGTFTHTSGAKIQNLPGYYDGNNTWKIGFMPTLTGDWTYVTSSTDPDLNGKTGTITVVASGRPGMLKADTSNSRKWKFADGAYAVPIATRTEFFSEPAALSTFTQVADFMQTNNLHMMETRLIESYGQFGGRYDFIFEGDWRNHQFDLAVWQQFEERLDVLAQRGLGSHIQFYSDGQGSPPWSGKSATEALVIRYVIARTAGYPVVVYNSGIDVFEYRTCSDIEWFGQQIRNLDPYDHPVSSRHGTSACSTGYNGYMSGQTFNSKVYNQARISPMITYHNEYSIPTSMDDAWGENRSSHPAKNHSPEDIRRAFWKALVAGGVGGLIRGGGNGCYNGFICLANYATELESEQWLRHVNPFLQNQLDNTFGQMVNDSTLVVSSSDPNGGGDKVFALADPSRSKIVYLYVGENDGKYVTLDKKSTSTPDKIGANLTGISGTFTAQWFDTRTGSLTSAGTLAGGVKHYLSVPAPVNDDWILLLTSSSIPTPTGPTSTPTPTVPTSTPTVTPTSGPTPTPGANPISNIIAASGLVYTTDTLALNKDVYIDRAYKFTAVPSFLSGHSYIKTANADSGRQELDFLRFSLNKAATVYVGYDIRGTVLPSWLDTSWQQDTREPFASADTGFTLYKKSYPQGEVVLGGNKTPPSQGAGSMYTVVVVPQQTSLTPTPATPGDTDSDGDVDLSDLTTLLTDFGKSGTTLPGDTDGDGDVDLADLTTLLSNFGR